MIYFEEFIGNLKFEYSEIKQVVTCNQFLYNTFYKYILTSNIFDDE